MRWQRDEDASRSNIQSTLLTRYKNIANREKSDDTISDPTQQHAEHVIAIVQNFRRIHWSKIGFIESVQRLELLSPDLMDEDEEAQRN